MKAVILDLDGVYFTSGKENFIRNINKKYSVPVNLIEDVFLKSENMKKYKQGLLSRDGFWDFAKNAWHLNIRTEEILKILQEGYELNGKKKEIMRLLNNYGIKKILCTNNFPERIRVLNERFDFLEQFDYIILSYEHRMLKPKLLNVVSRTSHFENSEIAYFDDCKENIDYAKSLGMNAILIQEPSRVLKHLKEMLDE